MQPPQPYKTNGEVCALLNLPKFIIADQVHKTHHPIFADVHSVGCVCSAVHAYNFNLKYDGRFDGGRWTVIHHLARFCFSPGVLVLAGLIPRHWMPAQRIIHLQRSLRYFCVVWGASDHPSV